MRLTTLLQGGPADHEMVVVQDVNGEWPKEIRVCSADLADSHDDDKIAAAIYVMTEEAFEAASGVWLGSYRFVGMKQVYPTLVQVWN